MATVLQSIVDYLRAGYPEGVPEQDYVPLFALLRRKLSDDERLRRCGLGAPRNAKQQRNARRRLDRNPLQPHEGRIGARG